MKNWKDIWENREADEGSLLYRLLVMNGYDAGLNKIDPDEVYKSILEFRQKYNIQDNETVFEIGCGVGAVLYMHHLQGSPVAGIDYAVNQIKKAREIMPDGQFDVVPADELSTQPQFDIVLSQGVFSYFPHLEYAETVLSKMIQKSKRLIYIEAISDIEKKQEETAFKKKALGEDVYRNRYEDGGLSYTYFSRDWFELIAKRYDIKNIEFTPHELKSWGGFALKFNCAITK